MILDILKAKYLLTFSEPRLSGRYLPEHLWIKLQDEVNKSTTLDELVQAVGCITDDPEGFYRGNVERFIIARIIAWEQEPPFTGNA